MKLRNGWWILIFIACIAVTRFAYKPVTHGLKDLGLPALWLEPAPFHLGWNWTQGNLLGFGVSGFDYAGWLKPMFQGEVEWLTGGAFGPESSIFSPLMSIVMIVLLWRWKGSTLTAPLSGVQP